MNTTTQQRNDTPGTPTLAGGSLAMSGAPASSKASRWLALGAVAGPVLFTLAWVVLGFLSPGYTAWGIRFAPYSPISQPVSGLGLGVTAPYMNAAFILYGLLLLVGVVGIFQSIRNISASARMICAVLFGVSALGAVMDGIFTLQSFLPHFLGFGLACGMPVLGFLIAGSALRRVPRWRRLGNWLLLAGPLTLIFLVLSQATFSQAAIMAGRGVAGLTERLLIIEISATFAVMGWSVFRRAS